jgi:hypothetical protein
MRLCQSAAERSMTYLTADQRADIMQRLIEKRLLTT